MMTQPTTETAPPVGKATQIMAAAGVLFLERGYGATSMDAVARTAGVSKATLYAHFASKADLFSAIVATECARAFPSASDAETAGLPVAEALFRMGRTFIDLLLSANALAVYRVVIAEAPRFPELGRAFYRSGPERSLARLTAYLERVDQGGVLAIPAPRESAALFWGMVRSAPHLRCLLGVDEHPPTPAERDRHVRSAVELFVRGHRPW